MAEQTSRQNGKKFFNSDTIAAGGALAVVSFLFTYVDGVRKDAEIALDIVRQHNKELIQIREHDAQMTRALAEVQALMTLGGRFTREEGDRLIAELERVKNRQAQLGDMLEFIKFRGEIPGFNEEKE